MKDRKNNKTLSEWENAPTSVKFWNVCVLFALIIILIYDLKAFCAVEGMLSILAFGVILDDAYEDNNFWIVLTPIVWLFLLVGSIGLGISWIYSNTIERFNKWLNELPIKNKK